MDNQREQSGREPDRITSDAVLNGATTGSQHTDVVGQHFTRFVDCRHRALQSVGKEERRQQYHHWHSCASARPAG